MRHDWIFDVLTDLKAYCVANGLVALAVKADEAFVVAQAEVARLDAAEAATQATQATLPPDAKSD